MGEKYIVKISLLFKFELFYGSLVLSCLLSFTLQGGRPTFYMERDRQNSCARYLSE